MNLPKSDTNLIRRIKLSDSSALELLFHANYTDLCAYARKFLQSTEDAEEVVQEVFFNLWKNRSTLDEFKSIRSYLFTIVRNTCLNWIEARRCRSQYAELMRFLYVQSAVEHNNAYHELLASDLENDFQSALQELPQECRKIFVLSRIEGLKYQEIAVRLNISIKTVETQMSRALAKLRFQLKGHITLLLAFLLSQ